MNRGRSLGSAGVIRRPLKKVVEIDAGRWWTYSGSSTGREADQAAHTDDADPHRERQGRHGLARTGR